MCLGNLISVSQLRSYLREKNVPHIHKFRLQKKNVVRSLLREFRHPVGAVNAEKNL
jgi:hypothetical protein